MLRKRAVQAKKRQAAGSKNLNNKVVKIVKKELTKAAEKKFQDATNTNVNLDGFQMGWATQGICLTDGIIQGDSDTQRNGDKIKLLSYDVFGYIRAKNTFPQTVRVTLIRYNEIDDDLSVNGGAKVLGDVVYQANTGTPGIPYSPFNMDQMRAGVFTILKDKRYWVQSTAGSAELMRKFRLKGKINSSVDFRANSVRGKGALYLVISSDTLAGTNSPVFTYYSRVKFNDI